MGSAGGAPAGASGTAGTGGDGAESGRTMGGGGADAGASGEAGAGGDSGDSGAAGLSGESSTGGAAAGRGGGKTGGGGSTALGGAAGSGGEAPCEGPGDALLCSAATWAGIPRTVQDDFTIEAWINTSTSRAGQYFWHGTPVFWSDSSAVDSMDFALMILNDKLVANIGVPDSSTFGITDVATGRWVHVAMTRNRTTGAVQVLVNGQIDASGWGNVAPLNTVATISVGSTPVRDAYLEGLMDEVRLWNVVRTEAQLRATMHTVLAGNEPGLVAYYRFDALTGAAVVDSSVNEHHGTVVGTSVSASSSAPVCETGAGGAEAQ